MTGAIDETPPKRTSRGMLVFNERLSPEQRRGVIEALRDTPTLIAEDFADVLAILKQLKGEGMKENLSANGA